MSDEDAVYLSLCTCPSADVASALARTLVSEGLAACVNILPGVTSVYRWEGRVESAAEVLLMIKTRAGRLEELMERIRQEHPYDVPEVIAHPITTGLDTYLQWVCACTTKNHNE